MVGVGRQNALSDESVPGVNPTIEEWVARKDKFRVMSEGLPMPPFAVEKRYIRCLHPKHDEKNARNVLVVCTLSTDTRSWLSAARAVSRLLESHKVDEVAGKVQVEIRNTNELYADVSRVLPNNPTLIDALTSIRGDIFKIASEQMRDVVTSITFHMRVNWQHKHNDDVPGKPTVIVYCKPGSTCNFDKVEEEMLKTLDKIPPELEIHLEFLRGEIKLLAGYGEPIPEYLREITPKPRNGASIGVEGRTDEAGTLGGWLILNLPKERREICCALTCYHVVRSVDKTIRDYTDTHGVSLDDHGSHVVIEYPAAQDARYTMRTLGSLMSNPAIGRVVLASGYSVRDNSRMDWALIESPSTFTVNRPTPAENLDTKFIMEDTTCYNLTTDSKVREFGRVHLGDWVLKTERTIKTTSGDINALPRINVNWPSGLVTDEIEILSHSGTLQHQGIRDRW
ncbi:hypothetical protein AJ80_07663 [Polytolypa hystricis UAMH7299]|uniref:Uncharacterized protein n=1 Tax=Polytolypa hystricis (strain UAMH7299) TaxID=1447883 RepID=A0A2B7XDA8_POLH7|nr:hypothetical protein AJ80_07663 [Polytolypa hystricis UAMH7299]